MCNATAALCCRTFCLTIRPRACPPPAPPYCMYCPPVCLQDCFPQWRPQNLQSVVPTLDPLGVDLLARLLHYNPAERITARAALQHEYFQTP